MSFWGELSVSLSHVSLRACVVPSCLNKAGNGLGLTTGTGHAKRSTFRKSSIYIETCILQTPSPTTKQTRMDNSLNPILYLTLPLFFRNFLNEPVRKRLLDSLRKYHEVLCQVFF